MPIQRIDSDFVYHKIGGLEVRFEISDEDLSSDAVQYFGYLSETGAYIIQQRTVATGAYRYNMGASGYVDAWTNRASTTTYGLFSAL
jgi:hypothetical protein